ncbi:MAG: hypothetical protein EXR07_01540 [Acetobacteraceae bacterium]|nr:hypothetical protein [Acetobacteraceae bacterium]
MRSGRPHLPSLTILCVLLLAGPAQAQLLTSLFPEGVPGYGTEQGVTVRSRARPAFEPLGVRADTVMIRPLLGVSAGYDDNIFGGPARRGAWQIATRPSVLASVERSNTSLGFFASADDVRYPTAPAQNRTDGAVFMGGTIELGRDKLTLGAGYLARHQDRTELDALPSDRPVAFRVENMRVSYSTVFGRLTTIPSFELARWRFANTTVLGLPVTQTARDRTTAQGALTLRYGWMPGRDLLVVARVLDTRYDHPALGQASNNSTSWQSLIGVDYDDNALWRYRLLGGVEYRESASPAVPITTIGIVDADITWSPTGMTTVRASATRGVEDAAQSGLSSFTYTSGQLTLDHEYLRNLLLHASASLRHARFNRTGGQQLGFSFGAGVTWMIDRNVRMSLTHDVADVRNMHLPVGTVAGDYTRNLTLLTVRLGL